MKNYYSNKRLVIYALSLIMVAFFSSCEDRLLQTDVESDVAVTAAKKASLSSQNYLIVSDSETLPDGLVEELASYGDIVQSIPEVGMVVVTPSATNFAKKVGKLNGVRSVIPDLNLLWLEPEEVVNMANPPSIGDDEWFFQYQWGLDAIDAPEAWNTGVTGEGAKVFILDSGIDAEHPDLAPNLNTTLCASFVPGEDWNVQPGFYFNHGTHVAGIVAAADNLATDPNAGVIGVAPNAEIVAVKVLSEYSGSGAFSWIIEGIIYAADAGADIINMSLGAVLNKNGFVYDAEGNLVGRYAPSEIQELLHATQKALNYAYKMGVTTIVSAGNDYINADGNGSGVIIPADLNNVITVSATAPRGIFYDPTSSLDYIASYSNTGRSLIDIAAPGGDFTLYPDPNYYYDMVLSTISGGWSFAAGTSMASPHVAGVAALILSKNPGLSNKDLEKQLINTADKLDGNGASVSYGKGRVNAYRAVTE